jgi:biofilm PGA synthesis N-glycosyltransferase PgaC
LLMLTLITLGRYFLLSRIKEKEVSISQISLHNLTVVVPFRNEEDNLKHFVSCIQNSTKHPIKFIFVDDHSEDDSFEYLNEVSKGHSEFVMLQLDKNKEGKKHAIRKGIYQCETEYVLTMDADVFFDIDFFENISTLQKHDLIILPVKMFHKKWYQHFFILDLYIANAANEGISGFFRPVMASGANLLINREKFLIWDSQRNFDFLGGDDLNILKDFRINNGDIQIEIDGKYSVKTEAPKTIKAYFSQRLRWTRNAMQVRDDLSSFLVLIQLFLTFSMVIMLCYLLANSYINNAILLVCFKLLFDLLVFYSFFKSKNQRITLCLMPFYELLFPIYILILSFGVLFIKPIWKNRIIHQL